MGTKNKSQELMTRDQDWNHFWQRDQTEPFTKISWSKRRIINIIKPYLEGRNNALDAGCGSGFFSNYFCEQGLRTVALDYSEKALELTQRITNGRVQLIKENLVDSHLSEKLQDCFDIIFTDGLLEHFSQNDQDNIMRNLLSVLSQQGVLITFVPNRWSPWAFIRPFYMPGIDEVPFTLQGLINLTKQHHLEILAKGGINTFPWAFSPDKILGRTFGMLLYTIAVKK